MIEKCAKKNKEREGKGEGEKRDIKGWKKTHASQHSTTQQPMRIAIEGGRRIEHTVLYAQVEDDAR